MSENIVEHNYHISKGVNLFKAIRLSDITNRQIKRQQPQAYFNMVYGLIGLW